MARTSVAWATGWSVLAGGCPPPPPPLPPPLPLPPLLPPSPPPGVGAFLRPF